MAIEDIDLGTIPLDGTDGDTAREAFTKVNGNFDDLDTRVTALENEPEPGTVSSVNGILPNSSGNVSLTAANVGAATTAQGLLADSAVQPGSLGTAAYLDANDFATNEQGALAETAVQPAELEDYERVLIAGDGITIDRSNPDNPVISSSGGTGTGTVISVAGVSPSPDGNIPQTDLVTVLGINNKVDKVEGKQLSTEDYTNQEKLKLAAIAPQATQNQTDAYLLSRANHTGTQVSSTISDFAATVRNTLLTGLGAGANAVIAATDTLLQALAKLQAQLSILGTASQRNAIGSGEVYARGGILGPVSSDASGVPTGAIIERGINSNGEFIKFADGTMICTFEATATQQTSSPWGNIYLSPLQTYSYAAPFVAKPRVAIASPFGGGSSVAWGVLQNVSLSSVSLYAVSAVNSGSVNPSFIAVGRWR